MKLVISIALGGAIGALGRHYMTGLVAGWFGTGFPWATLSVNVAGSFCLGVLVAAMAVFWSPSPELRTFLEIGILGAFTTFSAFSLETLLLTERHSWDIAALYVSLSVLLSIGGLFAGLRATMAVLG